MTAEELPARQPMTLSTRGGPALSAPPTSTYQRSHVFMLLEYLIQREDVYKVDLFKQLSRYCAVITFKTIVQRTGLAAIGFGDKVVEVSSETIHLVPQNRRTITAWGSSPSEAIATAASMYDERVRALNG